MAIQDDSHAFYTCNVFAYEQWLFGKSRDKEYYGQLCFVYNIRKIQVPRSENADGTITYQTYTRNLNIDVSNVDEKNLALSMKVFVKQVEGERNPLEIFTYKNLASFLEIADAQLI